MSFNHLCIYLSTWFLVPSWTMAFRKFNLVSTFPIVRTNTNLSKKTKFTCFYSVLSFSIRTSVSSRCVCCRCLDNNNNNTTMIFFGFVLFDNTTQHKKAWNTRKMNTNHYEWSVFSHWFDKQIQFRGIDKHEIDHRWRYGRRWRFQEFYSSIQIRLFFFSFFLENKYCEVNDLIVLKMKN